MTENKLITIKLDLTNEHIKLCSDILEQKNRFTDVNVDRQFVPERVQAAFSYVCKLAGEDSNILSIDEICQINRLLGCKGKLRDPARAWSDENNIQVNGYSPPGDPEDNIELFMNEYIQQHTLIGTFEDSLEKICRAYFIFEQIHPFHDGNGRTGRAICVWLMFKYGYGFLASHIEKRWGVENRQHYAAFKSEIFHYAAWLTHPEYLNVVYGRFYLYFLEEILNIMKQLAQEANRSTLKMV